MIIVKNDREIAKMQRAGEVVALAHRAVREAIADGITTQELDAIALQTIKKHGAIPSFKNYNGYPKNICTSVNNQIIHGIPSRAVRLKEGDIVSVDIGALLDGYHGDSAKTYPVGEISAEARRLIRVTKESFYRGLEMAVAGNRLHDISGAIQDYVEENGCSVVRDYVGHGVGREMHEDPAVPNYRCGGRGIRLQKGMTLAIEPMVNLGGYEVQVLSDGWTVITADGSLSAHYEHSIAVTEGEPLILTRA